jgi:phenylpropionate dioxygenase-like ring-hydroxylating dioxygenase large terminal subunit
MLSQASVRLLRGTYRALVKPSAVPEPDSAVLKANRGWDAVPLPRTWFIALRSRELPRQGVAAVRMHGRELAVFRTADGTVGVLDAYCPHLGADLRGGRVRGNFLQCPFHGLEWLPDGTCANLSSLFSADHVTAARSYPVVERNGAIHVWIDTGDEPPTWEPPEFEPDLTEISREQARVNCHMVVESMACFDAEHALFSHRAIFDLLRFRTEPNRARIIRDDSLPHQLGVEVFLKHLDIPLAIKATATFHGPAICSAQVAVKLGRAPDYTTLAARTYTGLIPVETTEHVADNAVYVSQSAPRWHRPFAVALAFWVHTVMHDDDTQVWDRLGHNPGGTHYKPFWTWYSQFVPLGNGEHR